MNSVKGDMVTDDTEGVWEMDGKIEGHMGNGKRRKEKPVL